VKAKPNVEVFRQKLENLVAQHEHDAMLGAVAYALLKDYNELFPTEIYRYPRVGMETIHNLVSKYCYLSAEQCPICGGETRERQGRRGPFLGCSSYPDCRGARDISGKVSINEALKSFLAGKHQQETGTKEKKVDKRWQRLASKGSST